MGHNIGISESYYRPTEQEVRNDFLKAASLLSINSDNLVLEKQVKELTEKSIDNEYIIKTKLEEKDSEIQNLKGQQMVSMQESQKEILDLLKDPLKLMEALKER